jgi:hypothetical protein
VSAGHGAVSKVRVRAGPVNKTPVACSGLDARNEPRRSHAPEPRIEQGGRAHWMQDRLPCAGFGAHWVAGVAKTGFQNAEGAQRRSFVNKRCTGCSEAQQRSACSQKPRGVQQAGSQGQMADKGGCGCFFTSGIGGRKTKDDEVHCGGDQEKQPTSRS